MAQTIDTKTDFLKRLDAHIKKHTADTDHRLYVKTVLNEIAKGYDIYSQNLTLKVLRDGVLRETLYLVKAFPGLIEKEANELGLPARSIDKLLSAETITAPEVQMFASYVSDRYVEGNRMEVPYVEKREFPISNSAGLSTIK